MMKGSRRARVDEMKLAWNSDPEGHLVGPRPRKRRETHGHHQHRKLYTFLLITGWER